MGRSTLRYSDPSVSRSPGSTPTPRGNSLDGQMRMSFRQVLRNGAMGIDQCAFVGAHFGVDSSTARRCFAKVVPGGGTIDEATFLEIMELATTNSKSRPSEIAAERERMVTRNSVILHKEMSIFDKPFEKYKECLLKPQHMSEESSPKLSLPHLELDQLTPANLKRAKLPLRLMTPRLRLNQSADLNRASSPTMSPAHPRSHSVPPMTPMILDSSIDALKRPCSAFYMKPFTPRNSAEIPKWKWTNFDNNVPKNIRHVLLKPMKVVHRQPTPRPESPEVAHLLDRMREVMRGITRIEAIEAINSDVSECTSPGGQSRLASISTIKRGLQVLGSMLTEDEVRALAQQCKALSSDGQHVNPTILVGAIIPVNDHLDVGEVGLVPDLFAKFKAQRLTFTKELSTKEVALMQLLRSKLTALVLGGPAQLHRSFKYFDNAHTGRCNMTEMISALELQGISMSQSDAQVVYTVLDPDGIGMDYNEFTAMMMPPDIADTLSQTVQLGYVRGGSKSRAGLRERQTGSTEKAHKKTKPDASEVPKFMSKLTPEQVIQVLKNRVALALQMGPGAIRKWLSLFDKDGRQSIGANELRDLMVDFGLNLSTSQVKALMNKIDTNQNGLLDPGELIAALLPADQFSVTATDLELKDPSAIGKNGTKIEGEDMRKFLRDKVVRTFVKKGGSTSAGYQIREAISRFDTNKNGCMNATELRSAMNGVGISADDNIINEIIKCYSTGDGGSAEYCKFVEDIDPTAFNFVFCAGLCAKSGSIERVEKEGVVSFLDPPERIRNALKVMHPHMHTHAHTHTHTTETAK